MPTAHGYLDGLPTLMNQKWLDHCLRGLGPLPVRAGDSRSGALTAHFRSLNPTQQLSFRQACAALLQNRLRRGAGEDPEYFDELVRTAVGMELKGLAGELAAFALAKPLHRRPLTVQRTVLRTLVDLRPQVPPDFWTAVTLAPALLPLLFTALLDTDQARAVRMLGAMPDDEAAADTRHVILGQYADRAPASDLQELAVRIEAGMGQYPAKTILAVAEWLSELPDTQLQVDDWADQLKRKLG